MTEDGKQQTSGLVGVLDRIAQGLEGQPALQAAIGGGILLVVLAGVVGGVAADQLWLFVVALVALVLGGLLAWAVRGRGDRPDVVETDEELRVRGNARIRDDARVLHEEGTPSGQRTVRISTGGDFDVSGRAKVGGSSSGTRPERRDEPPPAPDAGP